MKSKLVLLVMILGLSSFGQVLEFSEGSFEFGDIDNLNKVSKEIELKNVGEKTLIIENVKASCGCTASTLTDKELEPMETSKVTISFNPKGRSGKQRKSVKFISNDVENKVKNISFTANVVPVWEVKPTRLEFKGKADGAGFSETEKIFFVSNKGDKPIVIENIRSTNENLTISGLEEEKEIKPGDKIKLTAKVKPEFAPEYNISASIVVSAKIGDGLTTSTIRVLFRPPPPKG